ncbi:DUF1707 SHOCT-like domain-containing protein [Actinocatenispora sera]|uniref:DUF1707 domain-containing protein n=1 Tax=Actinocatenispora sera TaxID=390989 RepID=A0A810L6K4_9ACTN|nr:DUF1707 domain-containing protein [Actinocatenispora sera]BCJ30749.1 hypothetical protein Asera_48570 [Actinocatenispora sera]
MHETGSLVPSDDDAAMVQQRASDTDRSQFAEVVQAAVGDGRLDLAEADDRLARVYAARTIAELTRIVADLGVTPGPTASGRSVLELRTRSARVRQEGAWEVPPHVVAEASSGQVRLDFTDAVCPHREVRVDATCRSGSILVIVPRGWAVRVEQQETRSGRVRNKVTEPARPGTPLILLYASTTSGRVVARYPYGRKGRVAR